MKIAIVCGGPSHTIGGIENYNYKIASFFLSQGHNVTEYPTYKNRKEIRKMGNWEISDKYLINSYFGYLSNKRLMKKEITKLSKEYDLIINSGGEWDYDYNLDNVIFVQHFNREYYENKGIGLDLKIKYWIDSVISNTGYTPNPLKNAKNVVFFSKFNVPTNSREDQNRFYCLTGFMEKFEKANNKTKKALFVGRIEFRQKNVKEIFKNDVDSQVDYYGYGERSKWLDKKTNKYFGALRADDVTKKMSEYEFLVLPSNFEGCPIVIAEATSVGTMPLVIDTYDLVKYFDQEGIVQVINIEDLSNLKKMENNSPNELIQKSKKIFSKEIFDNNWFNVLKFFE